MKTERGLSLPTAVELIIFKFLKNEELLRMISRICKDFSILVKDLCQKSLQNEFSEYFQGGEFQLLNDQDIRTILAIMMMHRHFASEIHLQNTPYYLRLIKQGLDYFLSNKGQSIEAFPWAAVIMGNLMRVEARKEAAKYFKMAIQLPVAKTLMALTYTTQELKEMKLLETLKVTEQWPPSQFLEDQDFIIAHLKRTAKYGGYDHLSIIHPQGSNAHFEFLVNNFRYREILSRWQEFKELSRTEVQYVEEWHDQMNEEKDPVLASYRAAGLVQIYCERHLLADQNETREEIDQRVKPKIEECIQKGGFDLILEKYYRGIYDEEFKKVIIDICQGKIPVRPGFLAPCLLKIADWPETLMMTIFGIFARVIREGLPEAVWRFNIFVDSLQVLPVELTQNPLNGPSQRRIFPIFFAAQQSIKWILGLYPNEFLNSFEDKAKKNLTQYTEHKNSYVSASANMALGLRCAQEGNQEKAERRFGRAKKDISASSDYLDFTKQQGYRLPPPVAESKSFRLISEWIKSRNESVSTTSLTLNKISS